MSVSRIEELQRQFDVKISKKIEEMCMKFFKDNVYELNMKIVTLYHRHEFARISSNNGMIILDVKEDDDIDNYLYFQLEYPLNHRVNKIDTGKIFDKITNEIAGDFLGVNLSVINSDSFYNDLKESLTITATLEWDV